MPQRTLEHSRKDYHVLPPLGPHRYHLKIVITYSIHIPLYSCVSQLVGTDVIHISLLDSQIGTENEGEGV